MIDESLLKRIREAESGEEILSAAEEAGIKMSKDEVMLLYKRLHENGEIEDDELESVSGGACYSDDGSLMTTVGHSCSHFEENPGVSFSGVKGTCYKCIYWDMADTSRSLFMFLGVPLRCLNPNNRRAFGY